MQRDKLIPLSVGNVQTVLSNSRRKNKYTNSQSQRQLKIDIRQQVDIEQLEYTCLLLIQKIDLKFISFRSIDS